MIVRYRGNQVTNWCLYILCFFFIQYCVITLELLWKIKQQQQQQELACSNSRAHIYNHLCVFLPYMYTYDSITEKLLLHGYILHSRNFIRILN